MNLKGLATGIGSLPYQEAEAALDLAFKYCPDIPFWPQLPKRNMREGMIAQFSEHLPFLRIEQEKLVFSAFDSPERELEIFYERIIAQDLDYFKISEDFASGFYKFLQRLEIIGLKDIRYIKCQITGPFTFCASIKDEKGSGVLHDAVFTQAVLKGLAMKALWQIKFLRKFGKKIILFIDEPYLGCFGSGFTPLNREDVVIGLGELAKTIKSQDAYVGVHCCGNTDWSIFTEISGVDIINFDAFEFLDRLILYADNLNGFFQRGGILCWGIVPTQTFSGKEGPRLLADKIEEGIIKLVKKGVSEDLARNNLLISPACGLGMLSPQQAEDILRLLSETSLLLRQESISSA
ncbi:MAG: methionine synthase [Candidatus Omnitrophota bacterium]